MGSGMFGLFHYNPRLKHQREHAAVFQAAGFAITTDPFAPADVHVISGPHYAKAALIGHPRVLMIDRAWWGDPDCVSVGWLNEDGTRTFAKPDPDRPRPHPIPHNWKTREQSALFLCDYGKRPQSAISAARERFHFVRVRKHPAEDREQISLTSTLSLVDVAIGYSTTALFDAVMSGVPAICLDPENAVAPVCSSGIWDPLKRPDRSEWLRALAYRQFSMNEIADGTAWELLKNV